MTDNPKPENDFAGLVENMTPEVYANMKQALELGKWPDGRLLSREQREICMQAIIVWEQKNLPAEQRSGFMPQQCESEQLNSLDQPVEIQANRNKTDLH